jgi:hypothetical protein
MRIQDGESLAVIAGNQQHFVAVDDGRSRPVEREKVAFAVGAGSHPAATTGAGGFWIRLLLARKRTAVVLRARHEHGTAGVPL